MQREGDVCESVCETGVFVHGGCRCRACHLCVYAQCVCARARATISREQGPNKLSLIPTPLRADSVSAGTDTKCSESRAHARALSLPLPLSPCLPVCLSLSLSLSLVEFVAFVKRTDRT
jgi:hypothetical protein